MWWHTSGTYATTWIADVVAYPADVGAYQRPPHIDRDENRDPYAREAIQPAYVRGWVSPPSRPLLDRAAARRVADSACWLSGLHGLPLGPV